MNRDTLVCVLCYSGDGHQVEFQLPTYKHHEAPVLLLSPEDAPVNIVDPQVACRSAGLSGWKGDHVAYKLIDHMKIMLEYPQSWFLIHEADSLVLSAELPDYLFEREDILWNSWMGVVGEPGGNSAPPWFMHRKTLTRLLEVCEENVERWNHDWTGGELGGGEGLGNSEMIAVAIFDGNIGYGAFHDYVWVYQENDPLKLFHRAGQGVPFVTGIKTEPVYQSVVAQYRRSQGE